MPPFSDAFNSSFSNAFNAVRNVQDTRRMLEDRALRQAADAEIAAAFKDEQPKLERLSTAEAKLQALQAELMKPDTTVTKMDVTSAASDKMTIEQQLLQSRMMTAIGLMGSGNHVTRAAVAPIVTATLDGFSQVSQQLDAMRKMTQADRELDIRQQGADTAAAVQQSDEQLGWATDARQKYRINTEAELGRARNAIARGDLELGQGRLQLDHDIFMAASEARQFELVEYQMELAQLGFALGRTAEEIEKMPGWPENAKVSDIEAQYAQHDESIANDLKEADNWIKMAEEAGDTAAAEEARGYRQTLLNRSNARNRKKIRAATNKAKSRAVLEDRLENLGMWFVDNVQRLHEAAGPAGLGSYGGGKVRDFLTDDSDGG